MAVARPRAQRGVVVRPASSSALALRRSAPTLPIAGTPPRPPHRHPQRLPTLPPYRVLFVCEGVTLAHVVRLFTLARALDPAEYEVYFACSERYRSLVDHPGFRFEAIASKPVDDFLEDLETGRRPYDRADIERQVEEDLALLTRLRPDVVVDDFRRSLHIAAAVGKVPHACLTNAYWSPYTRHRMPAPELPSTKWLGESISRLGFRLVSPYVFAQHAKPFDQVREAYGLASLGQDYPQTFTQGDLVLYADTPDLVPLYHLPLHHHYLGPVVWSPDVDPPAWWGRLPADRPVIFVSMGSSGTTEVVPRLVEALAELPVTLVVATAGRIDLPAERGNLRSAPYLNGAEVARRADLVICNGGSPSTHQALREGTPVLGIPFNIDQCLNMDYVEASGAGLTLRASTSDAATLRAAVERLLREPSYRDAAAGVREQARRWDSTRLFPKLLGDFLAERYPRRGAAPARRPARRPATSVLVIAEGVSVSHVLRPIALTRWLRALDARVTVACSPHYAHFFHAVGLETLPIGTIDGRDFCRRLRNGRSPYTKDDLLRYYHQDNRLFDKVRPDLLVSDFRVSALRLAAHRGIPSVSLTDFTTHPDFGQGEAVPDAFARPTFLPIAWFDHIYHRAPGRWLKALFIGRITSELSGATEAFGIEPLPTSYHYFSQGDLCLYCDHPDFYRADRPALRPQDAFAGPLLWERPTPLPHELANLRPDGRTVYLSLGTSESLQTDFAGPYVRELLRRGCRVVVSKGRRERVLDFPDHPRLHVFDFVNDTRLLPRVDLIVCPGGICSIYYALGAGVPVLGLPTHANPHFYMERVRRLGVGDYLRPSRTSTAQLVARTEELLGDVGARDAAASFGRKIAEFSPQREVVARISALVGR